MKYKMIKKKIVSRKRIINLLLLFLSPTNIIIVALSQNLDKHIVLYQKYLKAKNNRKQQRFVYEKLSA
ncbi:MAG: hypothetical protein GX275_14545 [Clostridiales bacterium]|nr:hypothetical protein [Clostridiales bacterium]